MLFRYQFTKKKKFHFLSICFRFKTAKKTKSFYFLYDFDFMWFNLLLGSIQWFLFLYIYWMLSIAFIFCFSLDFGYRKICRLYKRPERISTANSTHDVRRILYYNWCDIITTPNECKWKQQQNYKCVWSRVLWLHNLPLKWCGF